MQFQKQRTIHVPGLDVQFQDSRIIALFFKTKKKQKTLRKMSFEKKILSWELLQVEDYSHVKACQK